MQRAQDDQNTKFNFDAAVAAARRDYPEETRNITFIDVAAPDTRQLLREWGKTVSSAFMHYFNEQWKNVEDFLNVKDGRAEYDADAHKKLLLFNSNCDTPFFDFADHAKGAALIFNHELGHLIVKNGMPHKLNGAEVRAITAAENGRNFYNEGEMAADCFAALRCLSLGIVTVEEVKHFSFYRGVTAAENHSTALALDSMMMEMEGADFSKLAPEKVKSIPASYAERCCAFKGDGYLPYKISQGQLSNPYKLIGQEWLENLADVCQHSDGFAFYTTAKTLSVILATGRDPATEKTFDVTDKKWDKVRDMIRSRVNQKWAQFLTFK